MYRKVVNSRLPFLTLGTVAIRYLAMENFVAKLSVNFMGWVKPQLSLTVIIYKTWSSGTGQSPLDTQPMLQ